jgi:uncharacterized membrane protein
MNKGRLEAFSDGVIAILITIMVLELRAPKSSNFAALRELLPVFLSYVLSFIYLGIYWNNHHHMMSTVRKVKGAILWANLHLLFWLSLVPFVTAWMGENHFESNTLALYGFILLMASISYFILQNLILQAHGKDSILAKAIGRDLKGKISPILYVIAILSTGFNSWLAGLIYIGVALMWLVPDKRIERVSEREEEER